LEKISNHPDNTEEFGVIFSKQISEGDIVTINGDLGAGKTTFIKGILKGLEYRGNVNSPTYTLVNEYDSKFKVIHIDCYREQNLNRWLDIGIMDYLIGDNVVIIEWPLHIKNILPENIITINIDYISEFERKIKILL
tara:strand:- start:3750 stop:4160 length:411 start_codon:yes stop_codon:yes gene_type:complete